MKTIEDSWKDFEVKVLNKHNLTDNQKRLAKVFFVAGALNALQNGLEALNAGHSGYIMYMLRESTYAVGQVSELSELEELNKSVKELFSEGEPCLRSKQSEIRFDKSENGPIVTSDSKNPSRFRDLD